MTFFFLFFLFFSFAGVRVVRYPCIDPRSEFINLPAHSMHTTKVRFNADDTSLFTLGGTDRALVQWSLSGNRTVTMTSTMGDEDEED